MQDRFENGVAAGLLILRVGFGGFLMTHGWGKADMIANGQLDSFPAMIGLSGPASLLLVTFAELVCAGLVVIGLGTRLAAVPVVIAMAVAAFVAHAQDPWTMGRAAELFMSGQSESWGSKQPALMFLIPFLALIFTGAGRFSIDEWIVRRRGR